MARRGAANPICSVLAPADDRTIGRWPRRGTDGVQRGATAAVARRPSDVLDGRQRGARSERAVLSHRQMLVVETLRRSALGLMVWNACAFDRFLSKGVFSR